MGIRLRPYRDSHKHNEHEGVSPMIVASGQGVSIAHSGAIRVLMPRGSVSCFHCACYLDGTERSVCVEGDEFVCH